MAPSRGKGKARAFNARSTPSRATKSTRAAKDAVPDVYEEMLAEEAKRNPPDNLPERPLKRRRVATGVRVPTPKPAAAPATPSPSSPASVQSTVTAKGSGTPKAPQTIEASDDDSDDESEFDFEDVDLQEPGAPSSPAADDGIADVSISVEPSTKRGPSAPARRKPASTAEKALHLLAHKAHVLCLIGHCIYVNTWCNDMRVQQRLHPLLSKKALTSLQGKEDWTQFQRDRAFRDGLEQASEILRGHFKVNASGMRRAQWTAEGERRIADDNVDATGRDELTRAAREMEGSQDTGNQLFCALLRSAGVDARLVCSLQPLPLSTSQVKPANPPKPSKTIIRAMPPHSGQPTRQTNTEDSAVGTSSTIGKVPSARRRLGQPSFASSSDAPVAVPSPVKKKPIRKLDYPIFWVEAFNTALQKWTPTDPLVTKTIGKPSKFEPPAAYALNQMSYVIAFEEDGVARDVTRRYTKAFNAKTRRSRVESTEGGTTWLKKALRLLRRRGGALDRDQTEDAELNQKEAREGLPSNVQDFKDHPVYALERHLKRHEMIEPKREVGKVNAGTAARPRMEPVYRRSDVLACRSAEKWYRFGRVIQEGQTPIKHVVARNMQKRRSLSPEGEAENATSAGLTALYASHQTQVYVAPPVVKGKVPRNAFGNLDIYVPSMVPPGGTHIRHALVQQAARILRVDYADAVTGFKFKGRHGTAIIQGAVVAAEHAEAIEAVIDGLVNAQLEDESLARSAAALRMWKRFVVGLRIKERVSAYCTAGEAEGEDVRGEIDRTVDEQEEIAEAGGFFAEEPAMPTAGKFSLVEMARKSKGTTQAGKKGRKRKEESVSEEEAEPSEAESEEAAEVHAGRSKRAKRAVVYDDDDEEGAGGFEKGDRADDFDGGGGFLPDAPTEESSGGGGFLPDDTDGDGDGGGGGFVPGDDIGGGGFLPEDDDGGGFVPAENGGTGTLDSDSGGGFLPDGEEPSANASIDQKARPVTAETGSAGANRDNQAAKASSMATQSAPPAEQDDTVKDVDAPARETSPERSSAMHDALPPQEDILHAKASPSGESDALSTRTESQGEGSANSENVEQVADADSDRGSLLSHDPEDEDAEPDWLESD